MEIRTGEKPYGKSIHTREEPFTYDFIIVSFIKKILVQKSRPLSNILVKINYFVQKELLVADLLQIQCLNSFCSFCPVKQMLIFIKDQHSYFSWLCILGIRLCFWTSLIHEEHCSVIPLTDSVTLYPGHGIKLWLL